jgi:hypothetical protein
MNCFAVRPNDVDQSESTVDLCAATDVFSDILKIFWDRCQMDKVAKTVATQVRWVPPLLVRLGSIDDVKATQNTFIQTGNSKS